MKKKAAKSNQQAALTAERGETKSPSMMAGAIKSAGTLQQTLYDMCKMPDGNGGAFLPKTREREIRSNTDAGAVPPPSSGKEEKEKKRERRRVPHSASPAHPAARNRSGEAVDGDSSSKENVEESRVKREEERGGSQENTAG
eukprot:646172-Rhodomonas_salina.1